MRARSWVGSSVWVIIYNLIVGLIAIYIGIGYAIVIICLRHILWGIPRAFGYWIRFIYGYDEYESYLSKKQTKWPNKKWIIESIICVAITAIVLIKFNIKLFDVFVK
jgi:hypothetical protein